MNKFEVGDGLVVEIKNILKDDSGRDVYVTSLGEFVESEIANFKEVKMCTGDDNFLLLVSRQNDLDYHEKYFFDNWLDAYKGMFNLIIKDFTADEVEEAMKSSQIKIKQYSASVEKKEGLFIYQIIKLHDVGAEG